MKVSNKLFADILIIHYKNPLNFKGYVLTKIKINKKFLDRHAFLIIII